MKSFVKSHSLSIVLLLFFLVCVIGQAVAGYKINVADQIEHHQAISGFSDYLVSGAFLESIFENWESEFLQMALFVLLTSFLFEKGSAESKDPDALEKVDRAPNPSRRGAPWPVRKGGLILKLYKNSLSIGLFSLFFISFIGHIITGANEYRQELGEHLVQNSFNDFQYLFSARFWFESLQNWQSEFLSIAVMVVFTIYLRQYGSAQSKPVDASHDETG